jgi:ribosomal protein L11
MTYKAKTYEVTTTITITSKHIVEADGEETAKEQAEEMTFGNLSRDIATTIANADIEQESVELTSTTDESKQYA